MNNVWINNLDTSGIDYYDDEFIDKLFARFMSTKCSDGRYFSQVPLDDNEMRRVRNGFGIGALCMHRFLLNTGKLKMENDEI